MELISGDDGDHDDDGGDGGGGDHGDHGALPPSCSNSRSRGGRIES